MREITQLYVQGSNRTDGHTNDGIPGDCWRAALASLLDLDVEEVPHFGLYVSWWLESRRWMRSRGVDLAYYYASDWIGADSGPPMVLDGPSPRGPFRHCVVGLPGTGELVWDPHPTRMGLVEVEGFFMITEPYDNLPDRLMLEA